MRYEIPADMLRTLVGQLVEEWIRAGERQVAERTYDDMAAFRSMHDDTFRGPRVAFDAYLIAAELRNRNPNFKIPQVDVAIVLPRARALANAVAEGVYARGEAPRDHRCAFMYFPVSHAD